jgi:hypothetical protein
MEKLVRDAPGDAQMIARKRIATFAITMVAATGLIVFGILHEEMVEVLFSACMLCLSCTGMD